jgi:hypothetical protein
MGRRGIERLGTRQAMAAKRFAAISFVSDIPYVAGLQPLDSSSAIPGPAAQAVMLPGLRPSGMVLIYTFQ